MNEFYQFLDKILTAKQQASFAIITIGVLSATQAFKNIWFGFFPQSNRNKKKAIVWLAAFTFGLIGGFLGYLSKNLHQDLWFWVFSGISSSAMAIGLFWVVKKVIVYRLKKS